MSDHEKLIRSVQEQATAAWVNHLNQMRIDGLLHAISAQDVNLEAALKCIDETMKTIKLEIVDRNLGGFDGMHGFIAEAAEVGVGNARKLILGGEKVYQWVNDNGPTDLLRSGLHIQQKFVRAGGRYGLYAVGQHLRKYPDYVMDGGRYQLPSDDFDVIRRLRAMPHEYASKHLTRRGDGPTFEDWKWVNNFLDERGIDTEALEPSLLEYSSVQRDRYAGTLDAERKSLLGTDSVQRADAVRAAGASLREGAKATFVGAALEGGTAFILAVVAKRREGRSFAQFTRDDWSEIAAASGIGVAKGGVRGASTYVLTNFGRTSAATASAMVTVGFGIAEQVNKLRRGKIDEAEFIQNSELVALEAAVSALSAMVGQILIPLPVLGALVGNAVGMILYQSAKSYLSEREMEIIERYRDDQRALNERLAAEYQGLLTQLERSMATFLDVIDHAFSLDVQVAFAGSIQLAVVLQVAPERLLDDESKIAAYFLD